MDNSEVRVSHHNTLLNKRKLYYCDGGAIDAINKLNELRRVMRKPDFCAFEDKDGCGEVSARLSERAFICNAENTRGLENLSIEYFPIVLNYNEKENVIYSRGCNELMPSENAAVHDGFYRGNARIKCVGHGHSPLIYNYCSAKENDAIIIGGEKRNIPGLRRLAIEAGKDERILKHDWSRFGGGNYGFFIEKEDKNSFYIVGESINDVLFGLLASGNKSLSEMIGSFNRELSSLPNCEIY